MSTTVSKPLADYIARTNGWMRELAHHYRTADDRRCVRITAFETASGITDYGLTFEGEQNRYEPSSYVQNPRTYWEVTRIDGVPS